MIIIIFCLSVFCFLVVFFAIRSLGITEDDKNKGSLKYRIITNINNEGIVYYIPEFLKDTSLGYRWKAFRVYCAGRGYEGWYKQTCSSEEEAKAFIENHADRKSRITAFNPEQIDV